MQGDTSSLSSRKITLETMEHKGLCGSASDEGTPGLPSRSCCWDSTSQSVQREQRGLCIGGHGPTGLGHSTRGSTDEWAPAEPCREALGIAVGAKTAEFSTSHYSPEGHTCWNTAGRDEVSIQEQIPTLFLKSDEAITALLCLVPDWEASC